MLRTWALAVLIVLAGRAAAVNPGDRPVKLSNENEAIQFADQLNSLTSAIAGQYIKPVPQEELLTAALRGLYDAAGKPFPATVAQDLKNAKADTERFAILVNARRRLGDDAALAGNRALFIAIRALTNVLDQHSTLVPSTSFQTGAAAPAGFGFELDGETASQRNPALADPRMELPNTAPPIPFRVAKVFLGGPAQRAGLRPGDVITHLDGKEITAANHKAIYEEVLREPLDLTNPRGHAFAVLRDGKTEPVKISMSRHVYEPESVFGARRLEDNSWSFWLDEDAKIAYIRVGAIDSKTPQQLADALGSLHDAKGLILDLRWCPGGFLNQSAEIAGLFLGTGKIASINYRQPGRQGPSDFRADGFGLQRIRFKDAPVLVLVNGETSGGGELIAAALQDNERAKVAGQRTLGKASIQTPIYLNGLPQWSFKLSAGTFVRPSGKNLQRFSESKVEDDWGVRPDKDGGIAISEALGRRLKAWHEDYALRPPTSRDALPLDDPDADPQRTRALRMMKGMIR
jgi:C-terminal peptidase prc